jgi:hypothetical protein
LMAVDEEAWALTKVSYKGVTALRYES